MRTDVKIEKLRSVADKWEDRLVFFKFWKEQDTSIMFYSFMNVSGIKGLGAKALKEVCDTCDKLNVDLVLWTYNDKLVNYYKAFGFSLEENSRFNLFMRRRPTMSKCINIITMKAAHEKTIRDNNLKRHSFVALGDLQALCVKKPEPKQHWSYIGDWKKVKGHYYA